MKTTLKVTVKNCGKCNGTLGWFKNLLEDSEIIIRPTLSGEPLLWLHEKHKKDGSETTEKEGNTWICGPQNPVFENGDLGYKERGNYKSIYVLDSDYNHGFSSYALTPACYKAIEEFIDQCVEQFAEWFEAQ